MAAPVDSLTCELVYEMSRGLDGDYHVTGFTRIDFGLRAEASGPNPGDEVVEIVSGVAQLVDFDRLETLGIWADDAFESDSDVYGQTYNLLFDPGNWPTDRFREVVGDDRPRRILVLESIHVEPTYRRRGLASLVLADLLSTLRPEYAVALVGARERSDLVRSFGFTRLKGRVWALKVLDTDVWERCDAAFARYSAAGG